MTSSSSGAGGDGTGGSGTTTSSTGTSSTSSTSTGSGAGGGISAGADYPLPPGVGTGPDIYVATDGKDANDGHSLTTPVKTLAHAAEIAEPGSTIHVRKGTYDGLVISDGRFGAADKWIMMQAYQGEAVTIKSSGSGPTIYFYADSCDESNNLVNGDCAKAYWRLQGLSIQGSPGGGGDGNVVKIDTPQVQLVKNHLSCSVADIVKIVRTGDDAKIVGNEIWQDKSIVVPGSNSQGVDIVGADRVLVAGNHLHDLTDIAAYAKGNARETVFESNLIEDTGLSGDGNAIMCGQSTDADRLVDGKFETYDCLVRNNVIARVGGACVAVGSSKHARVENNTCYDTAKSIHAALFLTNESEVGQVSEDVEFRGNIVYQVTTPRIFTDTDDVVMTKWSTLTVSDNLYFAKSGAPVFSLKTTNIADGGTFAQWGTTFSGLTGHADNSKMTDPLFTADPLFTVKPNSPAVDAVACLSAADYEGTTRPQGPTCDIGAHEMK